MISEKIFPLVVTDTAGNVLKLSRMNGKAYNKSLEAGRIWHVHEETERVLPLDVAGSLVSLKAGAEWFNAVVTEDSRGTEQPAGGPAVETAGVMKSLSELIADRRKNLPEGSYTTYLFTAGPEKIRKKLGEEAVEVILASTKEEITSETADLLYHLLVFLESVEVSLEDVLAELSRRG